MRVVAIAVCLFLLALIVELAPTYAFEWQADGGLSLDAKDVAQLRAEIGQMQLTIESQQKNLDSIRAKSGCS